MNSPIGAMGMNSGIHDAINLADKLIAIARKEADDGVLDRYERQRRHVAVAHTQAQTIRNKRLLAEQDPAVRRRNHDELRRTAENPELARNFCCARRCSKACGKPTRLRDEDAEKRGDEARGTFALLWRWRRFTPPRRSPTAWPERPIHLIVPFPAGSSSDIVARIVAQKFGERLGQQLVVENRPGASGNLGTEAVARAAADGYTLGLANTRRIRCRRA